MRRQIENPFRQSPVLLYSKKKPLSSIVFPIYKLEFWSVLTTQYHQAWLFSPQQHQSVTNIEGKNPRINKGMSKKAKWNWTSFFIGATAATTTTALYLAKPKVPKFRLISLTSLQIKFTNNNDTNNTINNNQKNEVKFPRLDADLILTIHVTNPNILPVNYSPTSLSIYYEGSLLGSAHVPAGSQPPNSCQLLRIQARLNGQVLAQHAKRFIGDVTKKEMVIGAEVDIFGWAKTVLWGPRFKVHVDSRIVIDPVLLDVIDQENESSLQLFVK